MVVESDVKFYIESVVNHNSKYQNNQAFSKDRVVLQTLVTSEYSLGFFQFYYQFYRFVTFKVFPTLIHTHIFQRYFDFPKQPKIFSFEMAFKTCHDFALMLSIVPKQQQKITGNLVSIR